MGTEKLVFVAGLTLGAAIGALYAGGIVLHMMSRRPLVLHVHEGGKGPFDFGRTMSAENSAHVTTVETAPCAVCGEPIELLGADTPPEQSYAKHADGTHTHGRCFFKRGPIVAAGLDRSEGAET